jgi:outer membrane murein-binding lipoprotein Lpp
MSVEELRAELAELRTTVHAGFARMDRYFELGYAQHVELCGEVQELRGEMQELRGTVQDLRGAVQDLRGTVHELARRVDRLEDGLAAVASQVSALRDW